MNRESKTNQIELNKVRYNPSSLKKKRPRPISQLMANLEVYGQIQTWNTQEEEEHESNSIG